MFTLLGFADSLDPAAAFTNFPGIPDPHVSVSGNDIFVPELNKLIMAAAVSDLTVASQARLTSPSLLRRGFQQYIQPIASGLIFGVTPEIMDISDNPLTLDIGEALQAQILSNPGAAAQHHVLAWLADGPPSAIIGAEIRTIRATAAAAQVVETWANSALTFPVALQAGRYAVVGARCVAANAVAFRFQFQGSPWRPGHICANDEVDLDVANQRYGKLGVWGEFDHRSPPTVDVLGVTNTAQELLIDLVYLG